MLIKKRSAFRRLPVLVGGLLLAATGAAVAPAPSVFAPFLREITAQLAILNQQVPPDRVYVVTDKTLYAPGDAIWLSAFARDGVALAPLTTGVVVAELLDPKGSVSATIRLPLDKNGQTKGDFQLSEAMPGGRYKLRARTQRQDAQRTDSTTRFFEKWLTVQAVTLPRVKLTLDFVRKAYGPADEVAATLKAFANDNKPLAGRNVHWVARVANAPVGEGTVVLNEAGETAVRFRLPAALASADGLLTLTLDHEGLTESIARSIPIVLNRVRLDLLPEGGDLVAGLPGRVAVRATNEFGEPADVAGRVLDDQGAEVAHFSTVHDGLARFDLTPRAGRRYRVRLTSPAGTRDSAFAVPEPLPGGFTLLLDRQRVGEKHVLATVSATVSEKALLVGVLRGRVVLNQEVRVSRNPVRVRVPVAELAAGVLQLTLFDAKQVARAERLVMVNADRQLHLSIVPDQERYGPRQKVRLTIQATDERGLPAPAALTLSVVDDQNLTFADDKQSTALSWLLAEAELRQPLREPRYYLDPAEKDAPAALDLVLLTHGWRRFTWERIRAAPTVVEPPRPEPHPWPMRMNEDMVLQGAAPGQVERRRAEGVLAAPAPMAAMADANAMVKEEKMVMMDQALPVEAAEALVDREQDDRAVPVQPAAPQDVATGPAKAAKRVAGNWPLPGKPMPPPPPDNGGYYQARQFAAPVYDKATPAGTPRTDFRSTLFWKPDVVLDRSGRAVVEFYTGDAVTSYRAVVEGLNADGMVGRAEQRFFTQAPVALSLKLPPHAVLGDTLGMPLVLANRTRQAVGGPLVFTVPAGWRPVGAALPATLTVAAGATQALTARYVVGGADGLAEIGVTFGDGGDGRPLDGLRQPLDVQPRGYPVALAFSGNEKSRTYTVDAADALPGSVQLTLTAFPSTESDLLKGIAAILREPSGCFEQTSSSSYPNTIVLDYLRQQRTPDPAAVAHAEQLLEKGYARLTSFETKQKGYEWFGGTPAHEALTAYGLLQFNDMRRVRPGAVSDEMVNRTHQWLMERRDGQGGFQRSAQALDEFGRADDDVTNAYIVWALAEAGYRDIGPELARATERALASADPYQLALVANAQQAFGQAAQAATVLARLYPTQQADGGWTGLKHSVTHSTGQALRIETTALAVLAALKDPKRPMQGLQGGVRFLVGSRNGGGGFGSSQSTVLALKALTGYSTFAQQTAEDGAVAVLVDGQEVGRATYKAGQRDEVKLPDLAQWLAPAGPHQVEVRYAATVQHPLPYTLAADWRTLQPPSAEKCVVRLTTTLQPTAARVGESCRLTATVRNTDPHQGQPMTMALLGLPAGLSPQPWQLKELQERRVFDFYELRDGRLACYFRDMAPGETVTINLDLKAEVPGTFAAPASVAYLYYTDELKWWVPGTTSRVRP